MYDIIYKFALLFIVYPDTIDKWDEDKLKEVVEQKHGGKAKLKTDIVTNNTCKCTRFNNVFRLTSGV